MATEQTPADDEPFIPPPCMTPALLSNGHGPATELTTRDDADIVDEEVVISTADVHADNDELTADKAAEKMIERRIQAVLPFSVLILLIVCSAFSTWDRVTPIFPLFSPLSTHFLIFYSFSPFPFYLFLFSYLFSFVHLFPFYQNSNTPFPGWRS